MKAPLLSKLLNSTQAAQFLDISKSHLHTLKRRGEIPFVKYQRRLYFRDTDLAIWMEKHMEEHTAKE